MGVSRQEFWSGVPLPSPGDLADPGIKPVSTAPPALAGGFFTTEPPGKPLSYLFFLGNWALRCSRRAEGLPRGPGVTITER